MKNSSCAFTIFLLLAISVMSFTLLQVNEPEAIPFVATSTFKLIILAVLAIYEVIVRIIPTIANYSLIGFIIDLLKKLSDILNVSSKKTKKSSDLFNR